MVFFEKYAKAENCNLNGFMLENIFACKRLKNVGSVVFINETGKIMVCSKMIRQTIFLQE